LKSNGIEIINFLNKFVYNTSRYYCMQEDFSSLN